MRAAVRIGLALALAAVAVSARVPQLFPAPWNPELTSAQRERVEHYKPRFPHTPTPPNNPCRAVCAATDSAAASEECITCCRTARHHVPWNCAAERGAHGDLHPLPDAHNGVPNKCCTEWSSECWDRPSADNYEHSCDMCVGPTRQYNPSLTGCDSNYMTSACWVGGGPPRDGGYEIVQITGPIYVPGNYRTDLTVNITNYWYVNGGANVTLAPGAVVGIYNLQFQDPQTQPHLVTALGTGLQLAAWYTTFSGAGRPSVVAAPRAATLDFGNFDFSMGSLRVDSSYIPNVIGSVAPPAGPAAPQVRYLSPRYRSTILMYYDGNTDANSHFEVVGDSGEVTIAFSNSHNPSSSPDQPRPFRGSLLVDGTYGAKLLLTGQAAGWYQSAYNSQIYTTFTGGALGNTFAVTLANGAALSFSKYTQLDYLSTTVTGTAPVFVEFLPGANATDGVNLSGLNSAPTGSAVILDGAVTLGTAVNLGTANRYTCAAGCYSGARPAGGVCLPAVSTCTGSCAGACSCTPTTATVFASTYTNGSMCSFAACSSACLGGSLCAGANTCTANCPATTTAHFSANCQAQDGTCATACTGGLQCSAGGTCTSGDSSSTGYNSGDATARAKLSPVTVAVVAVAAALMLR